MSKSNATLLSLSQADKERLINIFGNNANVTRWIPTRNPNIFVDRNTLSCTNHTVWFLTIKNKFYKFNVDWSEYNIPSWIKYSRTNDKVLDSYDQHKERFSPVVPGTYGEWEADMMKKICNDSCKGSCFLNHYLYFRE